MSIYKLANTDNWFGRSSDQQLYLHEIVKLLNLQEYEYQKV